MVTQSGLWIKDEIDGKTFLIKSELIKITFYQKQLSMNIN